MHGSACRKSITVTSFKRVFVLHPALTWLYSCGMALPVQTVISLLIMKNFKKIRVGKSRARRMRMKACTLFKCGSGRLEVTEKSGVLPPARAAVE